MYYRMGKASTDGVIGVLLAGKSLIVPTKVGDLQQNMTLVGTEKTMETIVY